MGATPVVDRRPSGMIEALERLAGRWWTRVLVALWGFSESIFLPLVPDVLLLPLAAAAPRRALSMFGWTLVGALAGSLVLSAVTLSDRETGRGIVLGVPGIHAQMVESAEADVRGGDPLAMVHLGPGTPLKVYTISWWEGDGSPGGYVAGVIANRLVRMGTVVALFAIVGWLAAAWIRRRPWLAVAAYLLFWAVVAVVADRVEGLPG
jgi:hypothetical protein